jgi:hypothetical protein
VSFTEACGSNVAERGEHDDFDVRLLGADAADDSHSVGARHPEIREHDVERLLACRAQRRCAVRDLRDFVSTALECLGEEGPDAFLVIHHQNSSHVLVRTLHAGLAGFETNGRTRRNTAPP